MKSFLILCLQLGFVAFGMSTVIALVNYLTGWHLGFKGAEVPGDPAIAGIALVLTLACGGLYLWLKPKDE